jgi:hypothetical protein
VVVGLCCIVVPILGLSSFQYTVRLVIFLADAYLL